MRSCRVKRGKAGAESCNFMQYSVPIVLLTVGALLFLFAWYNPGFPTGHFVLGNGDVSHKEVSTSMMLGGLMFIAVLVMLTLTLGYKCKHNTL